MRRLRAVLLCGKRGGKVEHRPGGRRLALDCGGMRRGRGRGIPSGRRSLDFDRGFRLRLGTPALNRLRRALERLRIETRSDVIPLLGRFDVAFARRQREPLVGFGQVLLDTDAARVEDGKIVLAVGNPVVRSLAEPFGGGLIVRLALDPLGIEYGEIVQGLGIAGFAGRNIEASARSPDSFLRRALFRRGRPVGIGPAGDPAWQRARTTPPLRQDFATRPGPRHSAPPLHIGRRQRLCWRQCEDRCQMPVATCQRRR